MENMTKVQENYTTPRYRTPIRQSPWPTMKGIPADRMLGKVARGVFQRCVETTLEKGEIVLKKKWIRNDYN